MQLYQSTSPDNTFTAVPGSLLTLTPSLTGIAAIGTTASGTLTGLNIPLTAGTRLLLVFGITASGVNGVITMSGYVSAGVVIA